MDLKLTNHSTQSQSASHIVMLVCTFKILDSLFLLCITIHSKSLAADLVFLETKICSQSTKDADCPKLKILFIIWLKSLLLFYCRGQSIYCFPMPASPVGKEECEV